MTYLCNSCKFICDESQIYTCQCVQSNKLNEPCSKKHCPKCDSEDIKPVRDEVEL